MNSKSIIIAAVVFVLLALIGCCLVFSFLSLQVPDDYGVAPESPESYARQSSQPDYENLGDDDDVPTTGSQNGDIPTGGLGDDVLRADIWRAILIMKPCGGFSGVEVDDVFISIDDDAQLTEYWSLYCPGGDVDFYQVVYFPSSSTGGGVDYIITKVE